MPVLNGGVITKDDYEIMLGWLDKGAFPILSNFDNLWAQIVADNNCNKNYYDHIATWYGDVDYTYTGVRHHAQRWSSEFKELAGFLSEEHGFKPGYFNCLLANLYTNKGIAPHSDDEDIFRDAKGNIGAVATISLGGTATTTILSKKYYSTEPLKLKLRDMSCYVMPEGDFQDNYKHTVSKPEYYNPHNSHDEKIQGIPSYQRISLTFRHIPSVYAVDTWDKNHYFKKSKSIINGLVAIHKDTNEPCSMNPCTEALELQELGINMEDKISC